MIDAKLLLTYVDEALYRLEDVQDELRAIRSFLQPAEPEPQFNLDNMVADALFDFGYWLDNRVALEQQRYARQWNAAPTEIVRPAGKGGSGEFVITSVGSSQIGITLSGGGGGGCSFTNGPSFNVGDVIKFR